MNPVIRGHWGEKQGLKRPELVQVPILATGLSGLNIQRINQARLLVGKTGSKYLVVCVVPYCFTRCRAIPNFILTTL